MDLDPRRLFFVVCRHAFADGEIEAEENRVLQELHGVLGLRKAEVLELVTQAKRSLRENPLESDSMDPRHVFADACRVAWADGVLEDHERQVLIRLARVLQLDGSSANAILQQTRPAPDAAASPEAAAGGSGARPASPATPPVAGEGPPPRDGFPEILRLAPGLPDEAATLRAIGLEAPSGEHEGHAPYRSTYWGGEES